MLLLEKVAIAAARVQRVKEWGDLGELEAEWQDALIDREISKNCDGKMPCVLCVSLSTSCAS